MPAGKRKPYQAFNAAKGKKTKEIIKRNRLFSPLLRLPREIRDKIWHYAIGDQLIHIGSRSLVKYSKLLHSICKCGISEDEARRLFQSSEYNADVGRKATDDMRVFEHRHRRCLESMRPEASTYLRQKVSLAILLTSRQVYIEANMVLWSSSTWSFDTDWVCKQWMKGRNYSQRSLMKKIHLGPFVVYQHLPRSLLQRFPKMEVMYMDVRGEVERKVKRASFISAETTSVIFTGFVHGFRHLDASNHSTYFYTDPTTTFSWENMTAQVKPFLEFMDERRELDKQEAVVSRQKRAEGRR